MPASRLVLILGGTGEARRLADALSGRPGLSIITSLAGRTVAPLRPSGEVRVGGFGGAEGLADYLREASVDCVVDATHPYAAAISGHAVVACAAAGRPLLRLARAPWRAAPGDRWIEVASLTAAALVAPSLGARGFLTIGTKEIEAFAQVDAVRFLVRLVEQPATALPLPTHEIVLGRGPFAAEDEARLLGDHRIDFVIAKNSGGQATYGKIAAARALGLPVLLLRRPELPQAFEVETVEAAAEWVAAV